MRELLTPHPGVRLTKDRLVEHFNWWIYASHDPFMLDAIVNLDPKDKVLLDALQRNARLTSVELAELVNLSPSPVQRRQKALESAGIIQNYVTLLDQEQIGLRVNIFVSIQLVGQDELHIKSFEEAIKDVPEIMECYLMTGDYDYLLRVVTEDLSSYETLLTKKLTKIESVKSIRSSSALRRVVYRTALPLPKT